jgi:2Fe-2S ferredoxin
MPKVTYIEANGTEHVVNVDAGLSAMEGALRNGVPGIDGDCGGQAACATCHVFVDPAWLDLTGRADPEIELPMIELSEGVQDNSRLACQIKLSAALDGLILRMPEAQF